MEPWMPFLSHMGPLPCAYMLVSLGCLHFTSALPGWGIFKFWKGGVLSIHLKCWTVERCLNSSLESLENMDVGKAVVFQMINLVNSGYCLIDHGVEQAAGLVRLWYSWEFTRHASNCHGRLSTPCSIHQALAYSIWNIIWVCTGLLSWVQRSMLCA